MSMRNVRWVEDALSRNGGDREMNELIKVLAKCGYEKAELPMKTASPKAFADRVDTALSDPLSIFHDKVKAVVLNRGYYQPQPTNPNVFEIDLTGIPVHLQEVFKVHVDLMFGGLIQGERRKEKEIAPIQWDDQNFTVHAALALAFKNILAGHMADASNFLMFINARGWDVTPLDFRQNLPQLPWDEEPITVNGAKAPPLPQIPRSGAKKPNTSFYSQTHGRDIPDAFMSRMKDELYEGKINWIRTVPGYDDLFHVLALAYDQAARGKGKERHANNKPFAQQPLFELADKFSTGFLLGQAAKKLEESMGLTYGSDVKELLGAIVYTAAAIMHLEMEAERESPFNPEEDI